MRIVCSDSPVILVRCEICSIAGKPAPSREQASGDMFILASYASLDRTFEKGGSVSASAATVSLRSSEARGKADSGFES